MRRGHEPVIFNRIFMGTTGAVAVVSGIYLVSLTVWRISHPSPASLPFARWVTVVVSVAFFVSSLFQGVCWIMVALSPRLWKTSAS
ncbi:MAG: hypothetical protein L0191_09975 [Acidobacteria bacterium]|nr:hypothetical protein [Acidobacteriota bacterium]